MKRLNNNTEILFVRKRLADLKMRLERVSNSWTVSSYRDLLNFYVRILPDAMRAERSTIFIIEMGTKKICSIYGTGLEEKQIEPPLEGSIVGEVISSGRGIIENDLQHREGYHLQVATEKGFTSRNMVCAPIKSITGYGVTGAVQVLNKKNGLLFTTEDLTLLEEFAEYLSISIESIILNEEILRISKQLNQEVERFNNGYFLDTPFIAESPAMQEVINTVRLVSASPVNILLHGENGTGKELIARLIHQAGDRREKPFVAVNCAAIPENLMESEFFGYERGAFTGATSSRMGKFEEAKGGILMLDEIADMPLSIQPKFLRAIQEGEGNRLGSNKLISYDFRIISATNKNLEQEVKQGRFREDLYFRLFSVEVYIPPLRERRVDILPLAFSFLEEISKNFKKRIPGLKKEVLQLFEQYNWPGNVRQLRKEIERLIALTPENEYVEVGTCFPELLHYAQLNESNKKPTSYSIPEQVKHLERNLIKKALRDTGGNRLQAAKLLDITRQGLHNKIKRYNLEK